MPNEPGWEFRSALVAEPGAPDARLVVIEGARRLAFRERPREINRAVLNFLGAPRGAPASTYA